MAEDGEMVMLSALQHYLFCPRQCALIHVEGLWHENFLTASGRQLHERTDSGMRETRRDVHVATALRLVSHDLGVTGIADVVEFHRADCGVRLPGRDGCWVPYPVEYKRGKPKSHHADEVQLCAQAMCLEEMFGVAVDRGALFYGEPRRRTEIVFDESLRTLTCETACAVREMVAKGATPAPTFGTWCEACSVNELCLPREISRARSVRRWVRDFTGAVATP